MDEIQRDEYLQHFPTNDAEPEKCLRRAALEEARENRKFEIELWPAPGSEDTELGVLMEPEVRHGAAEVYTRVQT